MSDTFSGRLAHTIGQLALALLNATLILVVLALFLALSLAQTVDGVAEKAITTATQQIAVLSPLADRVSGVEDKLDELRSDMTKLQLIEDTKVTDAAETILGKLDVLEGEISEVKTALAPAIETAATEPGVLIDRAVQTGVAEAGNLITTMSGCIAPAEAS